MLTGILHQWKDDRAYGFIRRDDREPDVFAHKKYFFGVEPANGLRVVFEIMNDERSGRIRADNVRVAPIPHSDGSTFNDGTGYVCSDTSPDQSSPPGPLSSTLPFSIPDAEQK